MPQMSPLNWVMLYFYFSLIFIMINSYNYHIINYKFNKNMYNIKFSNISWKW